MTVTEKVAYIKGLAEGMKLDSSTNEGKIMLAVLDVLGDIALTLEDHEESMSDIVEAVQDIEESVYELEDEVFGDDDDFKDSDNDYDMDMYDITCSKCDSTITVDYDVLDSGAVDCPNCGEKIEFDFEAEDIEDCD